MFKIYKNNKQAGMSIMEVVMATLLTSSVAYMTYESQSTTQQQMKTISVYESAAILRESFLGLISEKMYVEGSLRNANSAVKACIPRSFDSADVKFEGLCSVSTSGNGHLINLPAPGPRDHDGGIRFIGKLASNTGNIISSSKATYFDKNGNVCKSPTSASCSMAVRAWLKPDCFSGNCGTNKGPDVIRLTVEIKDHRKERKAMKLSWDKKPTIYQFYAIHDLTILKEQSSEGLNDLATECADKTIDGYPNVRGYPVKIEKGKVICGYHDPNSYAGDPGSRGQPGSDGVRGPNGERGYPGLRGDRGRSCISNRTGSGGCSGEGSSRRCPKVFVVSC